MPPPAAQAPGANVVAALPEQQKSKPDIVVPPAEAQKSKPDIAGLSPEALKSTPDIAVPAPEAQKSQPDIAVAGPEAQKSKPDIAVPASEAQKSKPAVAVPAPEAQKSKPDIAVPASEAQKLKPAVAMATPEAQKSKPAIVVPPSEPQPSKLEREAVARPPEAQQAGKAADFAVPQLVMSADAVKKVGQKIWLNETAGRRDAITTWNASEDFASLGIGHFIWFPAGKTASFEEGFPLLIEFLRKQRVQLPPWLDKTPIPHCPWMNSAEFKREFNSPVMIQLRQFLLDTVAEQTQFLVVRAQGAMDKILRNTPDSADRAHIIAQFSRMARASGDQYPLIDYIDFKGEGTNPAETALNQQTGERQGWGLKQVLLSMRGATSDRDAVLAEFADAARLVLQQRIRNTPAIGNARVGWLRRIETYRRPIADLESNPKPARNASTRAKTVKEL
ncbi:hypothetical protein [Bradyrhizobium sp.]|uniref:hypothetical protein n=1 Tax=Bradyrhizobium sp. TaxID=376 RepID=UPI003C6F8EFE